MSPKKKNTDLESNLGELEAIVVEMEAGDLSLEDSLKAFEKGIKLTRDCQERLSQAEQQVTTLIEEQGKITLAPFDAAENDTD